MMIKRASAKAKGRQFQKEVAEYLLEHYRSLDKRLETRDIVSTPASVPGVDIILSSRAKRVIPFDIEAKSQEKLNIWSALNQAEVNSCGGRIPLLVFKRNRSEVYACLRFQDLIKLDIGN